MKKLFLSFTALLREMRLGNIAETDLADGLFYFGCTRGHAHCPGAAGEENEVISLAETVGQKRAHEIHNLIVSALLLAESSGRVAYREKKDDLSSYAQLNELLAKNGFRVIDVREPYSYPSVAYNAKEFGLALHVVI